MAAHETMRHRSLPAEFLETNEVDRASGLGYIQVERYRMSAACSVASVCRFSGRETEQKNSRTYSLFTVVGRLQILWLCGMPRRVSCGSCLLCENHIPLGRGMSCRNLPSSAGSTTGRYLSYGTQFFSLACSPYMACGPHPVQRQQPVWLGPPSSSRLRRRREVVLSPPTTAFMSLALLEQHRIARIPNPGGLYVVAPPSIPVRLSPRRPGGRDSLSPRSRRRGSPPPGECRAPPPAPAAVSSRCPRHLSKQAG